MSWSRLTNTSVPGFHGQDIPRVMKLRDSSPHFHDTLGSLSSLPRPHPAPPQLDTPHTSRPSAVALSPPIQVPKARDHPVHALPLELLLYVFELGTRDQIHEAPFKHPQDYSHNFEMTVSHVCRYWRSVATRKTSLWTYIRFRDVSHIDRAHAYLHRSGERLLDIVIDTGTYEVATRNIVISRDEINQVFELVGPYIRRWRSFVLWLRDAEAKAKARVAVAKYGPASALETLEIYHQEDSLEASRAQTFYAENVHPAAKIFHHQMPKLRNLTLRGVKFQWDACVSFVCGLDKLELGLHADDVRPTYTQWANIIQASPGLKSLSLLSSGPRVNENWPKDPLDLPALQTLSVSHLDPDYLCLLFRHLNTASVTHLRLELLGHEGASYDRFLQTISDPETLRFPSLTHLHILGMDECSLDAWAALLERYSPRLTFLELDLREVRQPEPQSFLWTLMRKYKPTWTNSDDKGKGKAKEEEAESSLLCPLLTTIMTRGLPVRFIAEFAGLRREGGWPLDRWQIPEIDRRRFEGEMAKLNEAERSALHADVAIEFIPVALQEDDLAEDEYDESDVSEGEPEGFQSDNGEESAGVGD